MRMFAPSITTKKNKHKMKATLPNAETVKAFTQSQIEALPSWHSHDDVELNSFAKLTWGKAKSSLVFIIKKEANSIAYVQCNPFNGIISSSLFAGMTFLRDIAGGKMWIHGPMTMYSDIHHYVTNPNSIAPQKTAA